MKSILKAVVLALAFGVCVPEAGQAASDRPLMVIRFNNPSVDYQNSLGMAVSAAVKAKKDVVFDVLAGAQVPVIGHQISREIISMGVKPGNVNLRGSGINNNEVLIFVR